MKNCPQSFASLARSGMIGLLCLGFHAFSPAGAVTPAGAIISNQATLTFSQGAVTGLVAHSGVVEFVVLELIDVSVQWKDAAALPVGSPDLARALSFEVGNTGNGPEAYLLTRQSVPGAGQFVPAPSAAGAIFLENGLQPGFQSSGPFADTLYVSGNAVPLAAGARLTVYLVSDLPPGRSPGDEGAAELTATSATPGANVAAPGATLPGAGQGGIDAIVARGSAHDAGRYVVSTLVVRMDKAIAAIKDPLGGNLLMSGAEVTYTLTVQLQGSGTATNFTVTDPLPAALVYLPGSLRVNGAPRTDAADADNAEVIGKTLAVRAGDLPAPAVLTIELKATVE